MKKTILFVVAGLMILSLPFFLIASGEKEEPKGPVTIQYFSGWNEGEPYVPIFKQAIADFEEAHPNIKVDVSWNGRESITKVRPMLLSGNVPEIMDHGVDELYGALIGQDLTMSLNEVLETPAYDSSTTWKDTFKPGQLDAYKKGNEIHAIPWWIDTTVFYYNSGFFSDFGLTPPQTWDEFLDVCAALKKNGVTPIAQDGGINFYNVYYFRHFVQRVLGNDALLDACGDKTGAAWDDPGFLKAAKMVETLVDNGYFIKGFEGYAYPAGQIAWANKKAAMILISTWLPAETKDSVPAGFKFTSFPVPTVPGGKGKITDVELFQWGFVVLKDAPNKEEAIEFIKFFLQLKYMNDMPIQHDAMLSLKNSESPPNNADANEVMDKATNTSRFNDGVNSDYPEYWTTVLLPMHDKLIFGQISAEEFISRLKKESIDYWKNK